MLPRRSEKNSGRDVGGHGGEETATIEIGESKGTKEYAH